MRAAHPMHLPYDPADGRPSSAFGFHDLGVVPVIGGLLATVLLPAAFMTAVFVLMLFSGALEWFVEQLPGDEATAEEEVPLELEEEDVIEARFVQLGRDFEDELPNREVPLLDTAPRELAEIPTDETPETPEERPEQIEERPPDAVEDELMRDVLNRSRVFAEIGEEREHEGNPDGIEEGTEREGTEGDVYRGRLYAFFRRGWSVPTTLNRDDVAGLTVTMDIQIGPDLSIQSFRVRQGSGNPIFDQSVTEQITRLQAADQHIPPPPDEVATTYIGQRIAVRFHGRQAS